MSLTARAADARSISEPSARDLQHIPGEDGWPLIGGTFELLRDPRGEVERLAARYGPVLRHRAFGMRIVVLLGPEGNEFVLFDRHKLFSSQRGWGPFLDRLFPRGLLTLDFDEHRLHRKALSVGFKAEPLKAYLVGLNAGIARRVADWKRRGGEMRFYPAVKQLTLDLAATSFFGRELGADAEPLKRAFIDMISAILAVIRAPLPGTAMARGVAGRKYVVEYLMREIAARRGGHGEDLFSELCRTTTDDGKLLTDQQIVDHMNLFMMAAHDTLTSSLTSFVWLLSTHPQWQEKLRKEIASLGLPRGAPLPYERLDDMPLTEMAFKETLRLMPPVPSIPRRLVHEVEFRGYRLPAGTQIGINTVYTHHMPDIWPEPDRFDPLRFTEDNSRGRHKYAFVPYGGGAHMCLGQHFAAMQAKCFAYHLLSEAEASVAPGYKPDWQLWPLPRPKDGLVVQVSSLAKFRN